MEIRRKMKLYHVWCGMKSRCNNTNNKRYSSYGGRGIKVCDEWNGDFIKFKEWALENGYKEGLQLDRIDNDGNYEPSNCRWATRLLQMNNNRHNKFIEYNGERHTLTEWAHKIGLKRGCSLRRRIKEWGIEKALTTNPQKNQYALLKDKLCE